MIGKRAPLARPRQRAEALRCQVIRLAVESLLPDLVDVTAKDDEDQDHVQDGLSGDEELGRAAKSDEADEQDGPDRHGDQAPLDAEFLTPEENEHPEQ